MTDSAHVCVELLFHIFVLRLFRPPNRRDLDIQFHALFMYSKSNAKRELQGKQEQMKHFKHFLSLCLLLCISITASAHNFVVDGIYYVITSKTDKTVAVSYKGAEPYLYENVYTGSIIIPTTVTYKSITYSVTSINEYAFTYCTSLTSVVIPNSVTSIGSGAFSGCENLNSITLPNSVVSIGDYAFYECNSLPIINNIRYADTYLVEAVNKNLSSYNIKNGTRFIGDIAFRHCTSLKSITIPNSVTSIGKSAFEDCTSLPVIDDIRYADTYLVEVVKEYASWYNIKEGTRFIGTGAFSLCFNIASVTIPSFVMSIGDDAFYGILVPSVYITDIAAWCDIKFGNSGSNPLGPTTNLYLNDELIEDLIVPNSVTSIGDYAFHDYRNLNSITLPNSVTSIGNGAFGGCSSLTSVNIPNSVTEIGYGAFDNCTSLPVTDNLRYADTYLVGAVDKTQTSYTIKEGTRFIGDEAFYYCTSLASIDIPNSVTSVGEEAFYHCSSLNKINSLNTIPPSCGYYAFDGVPKSIPLYVPKGCVERYKSADEWKLFTNIIEMDPATASIYLGDDSFTKVENDLKEILKTDLSNNGLAFIDRNDITKTLPANFIKKNAADEWVADEIALVDAKPFYCPEDVLADEITYTRTFASSSWQALYLPFEVVNDEVLQAIGKVAYINNVHQYDADLNNSSKTTVEYLSVPAGAKLMANQMYVIKPNESVLGSEVTFRATNTTLKATANESYSCSSMTTKYTFTGIYQPKTDMATSNAYALKGNGFGQAVSDSQVLSPFRFFLTVENLRPAYGSASQSAPKFIGIMVDGVMEGNEATGIQSANYKAMTSGAYNLSGQKVNDNYKGVVVKNGRKVIVK